MSTQREEWRRPVVMLQTVLAAWGDAVPAVAHEDSVWVAHDGRQLIVRRGGYVDVWPPTGHRSIASDPGAIGGAR